MFEDIPVRFGDHDAKDLECDVHACKGNGSWTTMSDMSTRVVTVTTLVGIDSPS